MTFLCKQFIILLQYLKKKIIILHKEVIMKKQLLLIALAAMMLQLQAGASVTVKESTSPAYLHNSGYSEQTADIVEVSKARSNGRTYYTRGERDLKQSNGFVRFWRKFYAYFDPAGEDYSFYHHDTQTTPSYTDL